MLKRTVPGTVLPLNDASDDMFSLFAPMIRAADGLSLGQICSVTGLEIFTVQNWVKRGFVPHPVKKKYYERHFARILIISALKDALKIEQIGTIMKAVNGDTDDESDDIISEVELYNFFCRTVGQMDIHGTSEDEVSSVIENTVKNYRAPSPEAYERLTLALKIMVNAYISAQLQTIAKVFFEKLIKI